MGAPVLPWRRFFRVQENAAPAFRRGRKCGSRLDMQALSNRATRALYLRKSIAVLEQIKEAPLKSLQEMRSYFIWQGAIFF